MLQVDPSQRKLVAVLLVALAGAIALVIIRLKPGDEPMRAAAQAAQPAAVSKQPISVGDSEAGPARNPFERPPGVAARRPGLEAVPSIRVSRYGQKGLTEGGLEVRPMPVPRLDRPGWDATEEPPKVNVGKPGAKLLAGTFFGSLAHSDANARTAAPKTPERPSVTLLATVKSGDGYSAVLQIDDSQTRVVEVGDIVGGRYRVAQLQDNMAVLVHGREVIIATRPRS